ncbi:MAG TPA: hypothetical protein VGQ76_25010 [Thermoanaerobaculia bacterium]|jgi:hypothetical protein|nr:hypothetical protein [Thermoanaerobaculia bacterium]
MRKIFFLLCVLATSVARADHYSDTYVIPVVGHTTGANGMTWMSDVSIRNISAEPLTVQMIVIETGDNNFDNVFPLITDDVDGSVTINANSSLNLRDILDDYRDQGRSLGALILGGNRPFAVTSRAYSTDSPLGQTVPPARDFLLNSLEQADNVGFAYIPGIVSNASTRTNFGFVAGAGGSSTVPMVVDVSVRNSTGGIVGTRSFVIEPGNFAHHQVNIRSFGAGTFDIGSIDVRVSQGEGAVVPYASLIHNETGEAAYIMGVLPETTPSNGLFFAPKNLFRTLIDQRSPRF